METERIRKIVFSQEGYVRYDGEDGGIWIAERLGLGEEEMEEIRDYVRGLGYARYYVMKYGMLAPGG